MQTSIFFDLFFQFFFLLLNEDFCHCLQEFKLCLKLEQILLNFIYQSSLIIFGINNITNLAETSLAYLICGLVSTLEWKKIMLVIYFYAATLMLAFYFITLIYVSIFHYIILFFYSILKGIILDLIINRWNLVTKHIIAFWGDLSWLFFFESCLIILIHFL